MKKGKNVFVVKIHGGLGNQLYQFAFACYIKSLYGNNTIEYDLSFYNAKNQRYPREFSLQKLLPDGYFKNVNNKPFAPNFISEFVKRISRSKICKKYLPALIPILNNVNLNFGNVIKEDFENGYNIKLLKRIQRKHPDPLSLEGYWSDVRYFMPILNDLKEILFIQNPSSKLVQLKSVIQENDVSMHIRRGDYLSIGNGKEGVFLGLDYYEKALNSIDLESRKGKVWIFTDDYSWCKETLPIKWPGIEFCFDAEQVDDESSFELMRYFNTMILANSTYSLWAHYLRKKENIVVFVPAIYKKSLERIGYKVLLSDARMSYLVL